MSLSEELASLAKLHAEGGLSEQEYLAAKAKVLAPAGPPAGGNMGGAASTAFQQSSNPGFGMPQGPYLQPSPPQHGYGPPQHGYGPNLTQPPNRAPVLVIILGVCLLIVGGAASQYSVQLVCLVNGKASQLECGLWLLFSDGGQSQAQMAKYGGTAIAIIGLVILVIGMVLSGRSPKSQS